MDGVNSGRFQLIYGNSRLTASKLALAGEQISAIVFEPETTDDQAKLFEIAENYHRTELTPEERNAHMLAYAALLKKTGAVRSRREKQAKTQTKDEPKCCTVQR